MSTLVSTFTSLTALLLVFGGVVIVLGVLFFIAIRQRNLHLWLDDYARSFSARRTLAKRGQGTETGNPDDVIDVLVCVADHYEPRWNTQDERLENQRVSAWLNELPKTLAGRKDSDGVVPQHTFFYPYEEYREPLLNDLTELCAAGYGEIEIHLHHGNDTEDSLKAQLDDFVQILHWRHGALGTHRDTGEPGYAFVHGNWALNNAGDTPDICGVNDEIKVLVGSNCYVDMTLPSAPSETQVNVVNRIYYATSSKTECAGHRSGESVRAGGSITSPDHLMLITGPLGLNWHRRKLGVLPRIENGELADNAPCDPDRVALWEKLSSCVEGRPTWRFIKLHCHGVQEKDHALMLGDECREMYEELERQFRDRPGYRLHYVSAREMYNIARAAEAGEVGNPNEYRDYVFRTPQFRVSESARGLSAGR